MIYDWFRTKPHTQSHHGYQDLNALSWKGDTPEQMEFFLQQWDAIVAKITDAKLTSEEVLRDLMFEKMKSSKVLQVDLNRFKRARAKGDNEDGTPVDEDFCLEFLRRAIETYIADDREDKNLGGIRSSIAATGAGRNNNLDATPATKAKPPKKD